jgi:flagellar hook assembly protein FlgD
MWQPIGIEEETNHQLSTGNRQLSVHPNPAMHNTVVKFVVHGSGFVDEKPLTLRIHDLSGRLIRSLNLCNLDQSVKSVVWDGKDNLSHKVQPGVYFYTCELRMESGTTRKSGKLVLMER